MIRDFLTDVRLYGLDVAWFNLRFMVSWNVSKALIRRPIRLKVKK